MPAVWLISDTHFGHEKTCTVFKREDGSPHSLGFFINRCNL